MTLEQWAIKHGVTIAALAELRAGFGQVGSELPFPVEGESEAAVQVRTRLSATALGWRMFRNNVGAGMVDGQFLRWGLANDSERMNKALKSSDLIGIRPRLIGPSDVGTRVGQFVSLEVKRPGWHFTGTPRESAQAAWIQLVASLGGHARFVTDAREIE